MEHTIHLLPQGVTYYKANLHSHTNVSDGTLTPAEMKALYRERGYQILAFTDHNRYRQHLELNDERFLTIPAIETDISKTAGGKVYTYHFNWYDTDPGNRREEKLALTRPPQNYDDKAWLNRYLEEMGELGFLGCYNHPYWSLQTYEDYKPLRGLWAMEIYNHGCEMDGMYGYHPQAYDEMLRTGQKLKCLATDDNHNWTEEDDGLWDSFGGYVKIGAGELTHEGVINALKRGDFYGCTVPNGQGEAPELYEMSLTGKNLRIRCSPVERIFIKTAGRGCHRAAAKPGETITQAEFTLSGDEGYIRADLSDGQGRHTNSNACFLEDIWE